MPRQSITRRRTLLQTSALFTFTGALLFSGLAQAQAPLKPKTVVASNPKAAADLLTYNFKVGEKRRYKLSAFFVGHFPPIALEGNDPANLEADILYVMTVRKIDEKGAEVEFTVEAADVYLLEKDPGPDKVVKEADKIPAPVSLEQIQGALNVVALIQPNGSVATVSGGASPIKVDIGFDLRKMFLTILPVVFPTNAVKPGEPWAFDDGVLGHKPGATTYSATLEKSGAAKPNSLIVTQTGQTVVGNALDKDGNSTDKAGDQVGTLTGKVTAEGRILFAASKVPTGNAVQVTESRLNLVALLTRDIPDSADPHLRAITHIDVKARLVVKPDMTPQKKVGLVVKPDTTPQKTAATTPVTKEKP